MNMNKPYKIYGEENIEHGALQQFYSALELPWVTRAALMPDAHQGYALPIGGVVATDGVVVPSWVGYDIGCGMCAVPTTFNREDIKKHAEQIFKAIYEHVPVGFKHNKRSVSWRDYAELPKTEWFNLMFYDKGGLKQLGTLGGGNHFIEIGEGQDGTIWIIVHSGSRNVGHSTAQYYMREACFLHTGKRKAREWHYGFDLRPDHGQSFMGHQYIMDMQACEAFALVNRKEIVRRVERAILSVGLDGTFEPDQLINRNHNHIEFDDIYGIIHRKGATHARKGIRGVIPGNMRDGSFIVRGSGNPDALFSSSHGAGRTLSRKKAKEQIDIEEFKTEMSDVMARVNRNTLDESPMAYKNINLVMQYQKDLVEVIDYVKPIINVKG
jgi:tRNA-splicing ligase RtcB